MARRTIAMRSAHDAGVLARARRYQRNGWMVWADIRGWPAPPLISGRQPDVYATKNGYTHVIEVETSLDDDHDQHATFRRHAGQKDRTKFILILVNSAGRTILEVD